MHWQTYVWAFLIGGGICLLAQIVLDLTTLTPGHVLSGLTVIGGILGGLGLYDRLIKLAGGGATMLIANFGNSLVKGAISEAERSGIIGILTGMFELTSAGITAAIVFAFFVAAIFNPKD
ncbi:MAG: stage V sporulation protein AE [Bacteroidota bacterium]